MVFSFGMGEEEAAEQLAFFRVPWDEQLADTMSTSWINMGTDGVPDMDDLEWTPFETERGNVMVFQTEEGGVKNVHDFKQKYRNNVCDFWYDEVGDDAMDHICNLGNRELGY